ncbi:hypothetical protein [Microcystis aeruginosa]|uniref:hypothetical protein n=1 Tax=Microcystis aeruginosa TaxID=1126 RepID=UPI001BEDC0CB|nr:hypothetical protein [Microcystis aeruginosa]BCU14388.1 hypothetical protein MAN88_49520 [Microcystis aeruginosa]
MLPFIVRPLWLKAFVDRFCQSPQIGLLGESLNWECTWEELVRSSYIVISNKCETREK